jgi:hypothetical protein
MSEQPGNIAIYKKSKGKPKLYSDPTIANYLSCSYDNTGNLLLDGSNASKPFFFAELRQGSSTFTNFTLNEPDSNPGVVQWDGRYVAVGAYGAQAIYRVAVSGSQATVVGTVTLHGDKPESYLFWLQGDSLLTASEPHKSRVGLWSYPAGGKRVKAYSVSLQKGGLSGLTVSVGQSQ